MNRIEFHHVSKRFQVHQDPAPSLRASAIDWLRRGWRTDQFWALRDVSFTVQAGEGLGLIGSNGAGKSTTLKLVAGIISPTSGRVRTQGRVVALLQLGAGFHPELTGRENVYLFGSFHGRGRREMDRRFDEIVDFAELAEFMDRPVKHYSTGMFLRLAFSTATCLDPDVLLIDEALAVGDDRFRRKCTPRLQALRDAGTSLVVVSHSPSALVPLCERVMWVERGSTVELGETRRVIDAYARYVAEAAGAFATAAEMRASGDAGRASPSSGAAPAAIRVHMDCPAEGSRAAGVVRVAGWAVGPSREDGTIESVEVYVGSALNGTAEYGLARPDVAEALGSAQYLNCGYRLDVDLTGLPAGPHEITVVARGSGAREAATRRVTAPGQPLGGIDLPAEGASLSGVIPVAGWALDRAAGMGTGSGVEQVHVYLDGRHVGRATYGVARSDVAAALGAEQFSHVGWRYLLDLRQVAAGAHTLQVEARGACDTLVARFERQVVVEGRPNESLPVEPVADGSERAGQQARLHTTVVPQRLRTGRRR